MATNFHKQFILGGYFINTETKTKYRFLNDLHPNYNLVVVNQKGEEAHENYSVTDSGELILPDGKYKIIQTGVTVPRKANFTAINENKKEVLFEEVVQ